MLYWTRASVFYDNGWRSFDREILKEEYDLNDDQLDRICEILDILDNLGDEGC